MTEPGLNPRVPIVQGSAGPTPASLFDRTWDYVRFFWNGESNTLDQKTATELGVVRTDLAVSRTVMAADRTLMAWIRTALSLNSFGFTIYKLLESYARAGSLLPNEHTPRNVGLFLTGMGTFAMVMGVIEYRHSLAELRLLKQLRRGRPPLVMGVLMSAMGLILFFSILTKLF